LNICIYGAGVIGGILASAVERAGHKTSVIARGVHLDAIQRHGLIVRTKERSEETRPIAVADPAQLCVQDLVIVATKTPSLPDVAACISPLIGAHTLVAFAVNGIFWFYGDGFLSRGVTVDTKRLDPNGMLHSIVTPERALGIVCISGGEIREPGIIEATRHDGRFIVGAAMKETSARASALIGGIRPVDINLEWSDDIRLEMWRKFLSVSGNFATCALTGGTIAQVQTTPGVRAIQLGLASEAYSIARAHGFDSLGFDIEKQRANPVLSNHKPSMLQDLEKGRVMEIDSAYLVLQDLARQARLSTPTLDIVAPLLELRARTAGCR